MDRPGYEITMGDKTYEADGHGVLRQQPTEFAKRLVELQVHQPNVGSPNETVPGLQAAQIEHSSTDEQA